MRKFVVRREIASKKEGGKAHSKAAKIQRLVTPVRLQRKRAQLAEKKARAASSQEAAADYALLIAKRVKEAKEKRDVLKKRRLSSTRKSTEFAK